MDTTLGARLAALIADEEAHSLEAARRAAAAESGKAKRELKALEDFLEQVKKILATGILKGIPSSKLGVQIGEKSGLSSNMEIFDLLRLQEGDWALEQLRKPTHRFYPVLKAFEDWADSEGLEPVWRHERDGLGIYAWYVLTVRPKAAT